MTLINLTKDNIIYLLLKNIIKEASETSMHDVALNQKINELNQAYNNPTAVDCDQLVLSLMKLGELLTGYDLEDSTLPNMLYTMKERLEELKTRTDIDDRHFKSALLDKVEKFYRNAMSLAG
jgi:hypothetical protein